MCTQSYCTCVQFNNPAMHGSNIMILAITFRVQEILATFESRNIFLTPCRDEKIQKVAHIPCYVNFCTLTSAELAPSCMYLIFKNVRKYLFSIYCSSRNWSFNNDTYRLFSKVTKNLHIQTISVTNPRTEWGRGRKEWGRKGV